MKSKVTKGAKIRNRYNKVPHLTQDTNGKVTNSQLDTTNESQEVNPFPAGDHKAQINRRAQRHYKTQDRKTQMIYNRSTTSYFDARIVSSWLQFRAFFVILSLSYYFTLQTFSPDIGEQAREEMFTKGMIGISLSLLSKYVAALTYSAYGTVLQLMCTGNNTAKYFSALFSVVSDLDNRNNRNKF